jgi:23S rRNA (adenine2503-C2)-methyltransferase
MSSPLIHDLTFAEINNILHDLGEPSYRVNQIWQGLYRTNWFSPDEFSNLPHSLRSKLTALLQFTPLSPIKTLLSSDGMTIKTLFQLHDGMAIETVLMRYEGDNDSKITRANATRRHTLCISTQVGCAMGCVFCATGKMGFKRNLSSGEIVAQVLYFSRVLEKQNAEVTNIVLMGMGEPFHNYENVMTAITRLNDPDGRNFGSRRFTISTVGLIPAIRRFATEKRQINLSISLHSVIDTQRSLLLPINKRYPVDELFIACKDYINSTGRRLTFEWVLINGINDTVIQANLLADKLRDILCHVNLIPLNPILAFKGKATTHAHAVQFRDILTKAGIPCTVRVRRGLDIKAGCGQLAKEYQ